MAPSEKIATVYSNITKSAEDKREYRGLVLTNGMRVLLVSDHTTDKSSAAVDVHIGHMSDPVDLPGIAHFCEHMLFLGTEKYPTENEYNKFLSEHAGSSNAFTSTEHTNYFFDVAPDQLKGALDRFAQFFLCPLFTPSATEREVNAIDSENDKNLQSDSWRLHELDKATSKPGHDYRKFGTGNKETLMTIPKQAGVDIRDELLKFHEKYYSANIMGLTVLGKESLDDLAEMVVPLFSEVNNKNVAIREWSDPPFGPDQVKKEAHVVPVKDIRSLSITWPIPDLQPHYKSNPGHYLGHLIGHEGPGSLLSELKARGWVNQLVGGQKFGAKGFMFFIVNVDLSEDGIEHTDDIITLIFQYLNMLRKEGPQEWVFKECQDLNAMQFRFKDKEKPSGYACHCAGVLHDYPMDEVLSAGLLLEEYRPDLVSMVLDHLTPETIRVAVIGHKFKGNTNLTEKWYGTEYSVHDIAAETLEKWSSAGLNEKLQLPSQNEFIPTNFDLVQRDENSQSFPYVLSNSLMSRVWYRQDNHFLLPKTCVSVELTSPYAYVDPLSTDLTYMFVVLFRDALNEYAYDAELAGLSYSLHNTVYGVTLTVRGYNDKLHVLLDRVVDKMTAFKINPQRFELLKENYVRTLRNFRAEQPHQHAIYYTAVVTAEHMWSKEELLDATEEVTLEKLEAFIPQLLSRVFLEFLIYGNISPKQAKDYADIVEGKLLNQACAKPLLPSQQKRFREVQLPDGSSYLYKQHNEVHKSSCIEMYLQVGRQDTRPNMLLELLCQIVSEPCFDKLRTQEQLGYIVFSGARRASGVQGLRFIVQSDREPEYVETRVEAFIHGLEKFIKDMDKESFENHVKALSTQRLEKPKKLSAQHQRYWSEIVTQQYKFDRDTIEVADLKNITKDDLLAFFKELISHDAPKRRKLVVHVASLANGNNEKATSTTTPPELEPAPKLTKADEIGVVGTFKQYLGLYPLPQPFINLSDAGPTGTDESAVPAKL